MTNSYDVDHGLSQDAPGPLGLEAPDDTPARTGNTARDQEMYVAGRAVGEENAKHNAAISGAWLPIESAPKDGTEFQAWLNGDWWEPRCRFNPASEAFEIWGRVDYDRDDWDTYGHLTATHWMPLPAAPGTPPASAQDAQPDDTAVICPGCAHQFRAIPVQVQGLLKRAGYEPPFLDASAQDDAKDERPYCYALETRGPYGDKNDVLLDVEYNRTDSFSGGRTGGIPLYRRPRAYGAVREKLHTFLDAAAGEGLILGDVDAQELCIEVFPDRYAASQQQEG